MIIALNTNAGNDLSIGKYWPTPKHTIILSPNAMLAQSKNCPYGVNTAIDLRV